MEQTARQFVRTAQVHLERQHVADLGNGTYRNPILSGDYPDPSVVRVGADYYMTHSGRGTPGLLIWHSRDLVNWRPIGYALSDYTGSIAAPELIHYQDLFYIYFPGNGTNYVLTATDPAGPWSEPIDLKVGRIDPGHVADQDGNRYLHLSGGYMVRLASDGLSVVGGPELVYDGWEYPEDWVVECKCLESPKFVCRDGYYYLVSAQGGTAGPSTSHMIVVARSESPIGPWENSPYNPMLRTVSRSQPWWSQGHGTLIDDVEGNWWVMYHAYENGYLTLGRRTLLLPVEWTDDDWPRIAGGIDTSDVILMPPGDCVGHGLPLSDDFASESLGLQWRAHARDFQADRYISGSHQIRVKASGSSLAEANVLTCYPFHRAYEAQVEIHCPPTAEAGLLLWYNHESFSGAAVGRGQALTYWRSRPHAGLHWAGGRIFLKVRNLYHDVLAFHSSDGQNWKPFDKGFEASGYHHNILGGFSSLMIGLAAAGEGDVVFRQFRYHGLG